jgi:hypothetical protein
MYKLVCCEKDRDGESVEAITERTGLGNDYQPDWREISEEDFANSLFFSYDPSFVEHRQMSQVDGKSCGKPAVSATLYHFHDGTGYALVRQRPPERPHSSRFSHIKYYTFGCSHNYKELGSKEARARGITHFGMCWHVHECQKCGNIQSFDSSG